VSERGGQGNLEQPAERERGAEARPGFEVPESRPVARGPRPPEAMPNPAADARRVDEARAAVEAAAEAPETRRGRLARKLAEAAKGAARGAKRAGEEAANMAGAARARMTEQRRERNAEIAERPPIPESTRVVWDPDPETKAEILLRGSALAQEAQQEQQERIDRAKAEMRERQRRLQELGEPLIDPRTGRPAFRAENVPVVAGAAELPGGGAGGYEDWDAEQETRFRRWEAGLNDDAEATRPLPRAGQGGSRGTEPTVVLGGGAHGDGQGGHSGHGGEHGGHGSEHEGRPGPGPYAEDPLAGVDPWDPRLEHSVYDYMDLRTIEQRLIDARADGTTRGVAIGAELPTPEQTALLDRFCQRYGVDYEAIDTAFTEQKWVHDRPRRADAASRSLLRFPPWTAATEVPRQVHELFSRLESNDKKHHVVWRAYATNTPDVFLMVRKEVLDRIGKDGKHLEGHIMSAEAVYAKNEEAVIKWMKEQDYRKKRDVVAPPHGPFTAHHALVEGESALRAAGITDENGPPDLLGSPSNRGEWVSTRPGGDVEPKPLGDAYKDTRTSGRSAVVPPRGPFQGGVIPAPKTEGRGERGGGSGAPRPEPAGVVDPTIVRAGEGIKAGRRPPVAPVWPAGSGPARPAPEARDAGTGRPRPAGEAPPPAEAPRPPGRPRPAEAPRPPEAPRPAAEAARPAARGPAEGRRGAGGPAARPSAEGSPAGAGAAAHEREGVVERLGRVTPRVVRRAAEEVDRRMHPVMAKPDAATPAPRPRQEASGFRGPTGAGPRPPEARRSTLTPPGAAEDRDLERRRLDLGPITLDEPRTEHDVRRGLAFLQERLGADPKALVSALLRLETQLRRRDRPIIMTSPVSEGQSRKAPQVNAADVVGGLAERIMRQGGTERPREGR
jgi:hypothetical protein